MEYLCVLSNVVSYLSLLDGSLCVPLLLLWCVLHEDWEITAHLLGSNPFFWSTFWLPSLCLFLLVIFLWGCFFLCLTSQLITIDLLAFKVTQLTTPNVRSSSIFKNKLLLNQLNSSTLNVQRHKFKFFAGHFSPFSFLFLVPIFSIPPRLLSVIGVSYKVNWSQWTYYVIFNKM